jgi:flavin-dependent dehydrogenase
MTNESQYADFLARHKNLLTQERPVSGMVRLDTGAADSRSSLGGSPQNLAGDYILLAEGSHPSFARSLGLVLLGLLLGVGTMVVARSENPVEVKTP